MSDARPDPPWGHESEQRFFAALGWALARWSAVEHAMADLYGRLLIERREGVSYAPAPEHGFLSIISFRSRLDVLNATADYMLREEDKEQWNRVYRALERRGSSKRNKLAHCQLLALGQPVGTPFRYVLWDKSRAAQKSGKYYLEAPDFIEWGYDFEDLATMVREFRPDRLVMAQPQAPPEAYPGP